MVESGVGFIAGVGCTALFGVAVLNGVGMMAAINRLREEGRAVKDAALESATMRLQPALMTALAPSPGSAHALPLVRARV
jgi:cobalt-zinc-cadmium resistance protein CzcA